MSTFLLQDLSIFVTIFIMIIGFDGSRTFRKNKTGTENYSYQLLFHLSKIDKKNKYIVYLRPGSDGGEKWPENFLFKTIYWPRFWTQAGLAGQTFKDALDILFIPAHTSPLIHKKGLKTVVTVHDLGAEYLPKMHQLKQRLYLKWITNFQLKSATKLIAVSKATKEDLVKKIGCKAEKIEVVYEGFDRRLFKSLKSDIKVNILMPYYLFVGTVQPRKNLTKLIESFNQFCHPEGVKRLKDLIHDSETSSEIPSYARNDKINLVIAGSKGWLSDEIYKLPKKLGIEDRVKFLGYVPDEKLPALYSQALALVFPSLFEGFGLPILEAQACGCAVITSNISSMPEVAGKGAILVDPYSVEEITNAMIRVKGEVERRKLIKKGFENIKRFSWEKCARKTLKILEGV